MLDCQGSDFKITSHSIWKLSSFESRLDIARCFLLQFSNILEIWLLGTVIWLKTIYGKARGIGLTGQQRINDVILQLQTKIF